MKLTVKEFFETYPEESRVELIDGKVFEMPAPSLMHQIILSRLLRKLFAYPNTEDKIVPYLIDLVLSEDTVLQPDIVYLSEKPERLDKIFSIPEMVIEVVSPSTFKRDLTDKMKLYERHGVEEYWLVFPLEKTIMVYELTENGYELFSSATEKGKVKSKVLEGFELEVEEVFGGL